MKFARFGQKTKRLKMLSSEMKVELQHALALSAAGFSRLDDEQKTAIDEACLKNLSTLKNCAQTQLQLQEELLLSQQVSQGNVPPRKRKFIEIHETCEDPQSSNEIDAKKKAVRTKQGREIRLEQNRVAARKSRLRKKAMIENFQSSIVFYNRANTELKQENESLKRLLADANKFIQKQRLEKESHAEDETRCNEIVSDQSKNDRVDVVMAMKKSSDDAGDEDASENDCVDPKTSNSADLTDELTQSINVLLQADKILAKDGTVTSYAETEADTSNNFIPVSPSCSENENEAERSPYPHGVSTSKSTTMMNAAGAAYMTNLQLAAANFHAALLATASITGSSQMSNMDNITAVKGLLRYLEGGDVSKSSLAIDRMENVV